MSIDVLQIAGSLGVGAFLGLIIFLMYRSDRKSSECQLREDRKFMEDRLTKILEEDQESRRENTRALSELTQYLRQSNGRGNSGGY